MKNKISVIIPTVQKTLDVLKEILISLETDACVEEVILINNKPEVTLDFDFPKLKIITPLTNLYVNPSWNLGVKEAKCNNFVLLNDDLLFGKNFCGKIVNSEIFNSSSTGLIGMSPRMIKPFNENVEFLDIEPKFEKLDRHLGTGDWGISIFGKKENYYEIPDDLKIIYGDNYILYQNKLAGKQNYSISNLPCRHMHSVSSASSEFSSIIISDIENSEKYFEEKDKDKNILKNFDNFTIKFSEDICWIYLSVPKTTFCLKYKEKDTLFALDVLKHKIKTTLKKVDEQLIDSIIEEIIKSQNTKG